MNASIRWKHGKTSRKKTLLQTRLQRSTTMEKLPNTNHFIQNSLLPGEINTLCEVGPGNKIVANYFHEMDGVTINTVDIAKDLNPTYVGDVRDLPMRDDLFTVVSAFEVLEHIPFSDFENALKELKRVSRGKVLVSLPYRNYNVFGGWFDLPFFGSFSFRLGFPAWNQTVSIEEHGEHYWEVGTDIYKEDVLIKLNRVFDDVDSFRDDIDYKHIYYVCDIK